MAVDLGLVNGNNWSATHVDTIEAAINKNLTIGTNAERTALTPAIGQGFYATDTKTEWRYDGTGWVIMAEPANTSWTPTWTQGATISKTVNVARYWRNDGWCRGHFTMTATSAGTAATSIICSIPIAGASQSLYGIFQLYDASAGIFNSGVMYSQSTITWSLQTNGLNAAGLSVPTLATGDIFWCDFAYEMSTRYL